MEAFNGKRLDLKIRTGSFSVFLAGISAVRPFPAAFPVFDPGSLIDSARTFQAGFDCHFSVMLERR